MTISAKTCLTRSPRGLIGTSVLLAALSLTTLVSTAAPIASAPLPAPAVVDSKGKVVGRAAGNSTVLMDIEGEVVGFNLTHFARDFSGRGRLLERPGMDWAYVNAADYSHQTFSENYVYFTDMNCRGQGYVSPVESTLPGTQLFGTAITDTDTYSRNPVWGYLADAADAMRNFQVIVHWNGHSCQSVGGGGFGQVLVVAYPVKKVVLLDGFGTPPFYVK